MKPFIIGIAGGSGSGKTSIANRIMEQLGGELVVIIHHDSYYRSIKNQSGLTPDKINFDHPDSLDTDLLIRQLQQLSEGKIIYQPMYDFASHRRMKKTRQIDPKNIIIVDGVLIFVEKRLRDLMALKIFVDTDADERFIRRLRRDIAERGRMMETVITQYLNTVKPMHLKFVEPSKQWSDVIISHGSENLVAIDLVVKKIKSLIAEKSTLS